MSDTYYVRKAAKGWDLSKTSDRPGWFGAVVKLGRYETRKAASQAARLLAGWRDRVVIEKGARA